MFVELRSELGDLRQSFPVLLAVGIVLSIAAIGLLAWLVVLQVEPGNGSEAEAQPAALGGGPAAVSEQQVAEIAQDLRQPVYWAGAKPGTRLEVTVMRNRQVYVRYLPRDVAIGDLSPNHLSVRNFPIPHALVALRSYAHRRHLPARRIGNNEGLMVRLSRFSAYVAYRGSDVQANVFSPDPGVARSLAISGAITQVTPLSGNLAPAGQP